MTYSVLLVGWDVGPWKCSGDSEDALALLGWDGSRLSVIGPGFHGNLFTKMCGEPDLAAFLSVAGWPKPFGEVKVVIAVDAVFGWPRRFVELVSGKSDYKPSTAKDDRNTDNRFLHRETERFLIAVLKLKSPNLPKTAVGDAIGSAATKAQYLLSSLRKRELLYVPPLDPWDQAKAKEARVTVIEVYPGVTKFSPAFENLDLPHGAKVKLLGKGDPDDAMRCAMVAACYGGMVGHLPLAFPSLYVPTDAAHEAGYDREAIASEGWIFSPTKAST